MARRGQIQLAYMLHNRFPHWRGSSRSPPLLPGTIAQNSRRRYPALSAVQLAPVGAGSPCPAPIDRPRSPLTRTKQRLTHLHPPLPPPIDRPTQAMYAGLPAYGGGYSPASSHLRAGGWEDQRAG